MNPRIVKNIDVTDVRHYNYAEDSVGIPFKKMKRKIERYFQTHTVIETDNFYLDVDNILKRKFACCKEHCDLFITGKSSKKGLFSMGDDQDSHIYDKSCCEGGSLPIKDDLIANINAHIDEIIEPLPNENKEIIRSKGWMTKGKQVGKRKSDDMCLMAYENDGMLYCALHSFALKRNEPILNYKPYDCFIFPLDFVYINDKLFVTSISEDGSTDFFLRWGSVHTNQSCLLMRDKGEPMYVYAKDVLTDVIGEDGWSVIDDIYNNLSSVV